MEPCENSHDWSIVVPCVTLWLIMFAQWYRLWQVRLIKTSYTLPIQTLTTKHCWMQQEDLLVHKYGCCGCWKSPPRWSRSYPWTTPSQKRRASLYSGAQTNAKLVSMKVTVRAYSLLLLPMERLELLLLYKVPNKMTIHTECVINCAGACGGSVLKCPHQIVMCELSSSPCAVPVHCKCTSFLQATVNRCKHTKSGHPLFRKNLWQNLCASLPLPYAALYTKCMSASMAQVKRSMLMLISL